MATDRELPDDIDDAQMAWLLKSAYDAPELRDEFASGLARRLDAEFAAMSDAGRGASTNGAARSARGAGGAASESLKNGAAAASCNSRAVGRGRGRPWRRWGVALAAAASLLVAASIWTTEPAYGWAAVLRALDQCTWVRAEAADDQGMGWISSTEGVFAVRTRGGVLFDRRHDGISNLFLPSEQQIVQTSLPDGQSWDTEADMVRLLLGASAEEAGLPSGEPLEIEMLDESWRRVVRPDGEGALVELRVALRVAGADGQDRRRVELVLLVDPDSHLPLECRLVRADGGESPPIAFDYPAEGPQTIFALGVPNGLPIVRGRLAQVDVALTSAGTPERSRAVTVVIEDNEAEGGDAAQAAIADRIASIDAGVEAIEEGTNSSGDAAPGREAVADLHDVAPPAWTPPAAALAPAELSARIDAELAALWQARGIRPVGPASDAEFMRRVYLDLTGRVPTVSEIHRFEENGSPERRAMLVDDLLGQYDHASHLASVWRRMLLPESADLTRFGGPAKFDEWLATRFAANKPYDQIVADLLLAEGRVSESGPMLFYAALKLNPEELAAQTSRAFLGVRMECAQCHDHPFDEVSQQDFWSFAAFFARISRPRGRMEITSPVLAVRDSQQGEVMIPESDEVVPPRLPLSGFDVDDSADGPPRRQQLVDWLTSPHNPQFSRATVNRVWAHLFGRGLVEPVDDMRPDNPPISPELLETLAGDFAASGFDLRRLLRALVLTEAYQLSSRAESDDPSRPLHFAQMNIKSFTAEQLYDCIAVATQRAATTATEPADQAALVRFSDTSRQAFIDQFRAPPGQMTDYHAGIPQALTLMHGGLIHGATDLATSGLLKSLAAPFFTDEQRLDALFLATLSRRPAAEERELMLPVVEAATTDAAKQQALGDVLWALLNSAEFTFNH